MKSYLIKNYSDSIYINDIEYLFDNINDLILEVLETDGYNLDKKLISKILDVETMIIDFLSSCENCEIKHNENKIVKRDIKNRNFICRYCHNEKVFFEGEQLNEKKF